MNNAFIFDIDGVIIENEHLWDKEKRVFFTHLLGENYQHVMGDTTGVSVSELYTRMKAHRDDISWKSFEAEFDTVAEKVYRSASVTPDIAVVIDFLASHHFQCGAVTASPKRWIDILRDQLPFLSLWPVIYLHDRSDLRQKPAPDGYSEMMERLKTTPENTIILEDSGNGMASAVASGAFTILFGSHAPPEMKADARASHMNDVIPIVEDWLQNR